ncbi:MAG TPA: hypothetical protein VEP90_25690 [Methylomirabilota bacterium]|nr:hypothetical protein [Methylomirabilota bacterium]
MVEGQNIPTPATDEEHIIHALNIHGTFFERKCQNIVHQAKAWEIQETNYPVTYGGVKSNLDIWAMRGKNTNQHLVLPIECKKNNPDFINWIFFRQPSHRPDYSHIQTIEVPRQHDSTGTWEAYRKLQRLHHDLRIADEARETKGDYQKIKQHDRTRTSNAAITDAATQIAIATQALMQQEQSMLEEISRPSSNGIGRPSYNQLFIFPTIVTTAKLFMCEFQEADVDLSTGVIALDKPMLVPCPYLIFDYAVPPALQLVPKAIHLDYTMDTLKQLARMPIFIVHSEAFPVFLERLSKPVLHGATFDGPWYELHLKPGENEETKSAHN